MLPTLDMFCASPPPLPPPLLLLPLPLLLQDWMMSNAAPVP
jgi:hypothetical protein